MFLLKTKKLLLVLQLQLFRTEQTPSVIQLIGLG
jgi:hypothetical protein